MRCTVRLGGPLFALSLLAAACSHEDARPTTTFYERKIAPILVSACATSPTRSGCHVTADSRGNALGNLSVESYESLSLRRDLLVDYGPYGLPALLLKAVPPYQLRLTTWEAAEPILVTTDVPHGGGSLIDVASTSFATLERWIGNGATENNVPEQIDDVEKLPCSEALGTDPAFEPTADPPDADFEQFSTRVSPVLAQRCAAGNCHGTPGSPLYLTCGETDDQLRWNYFAASGYVSADLTTSEILRRTLSPELGGTYHEGGPIFGSPGDAEYRAIREWVEAKGGPSNVPDDAGFLFFARRVQPMLAKKGCMILGCHSGAMFHDYRIRGGSGGHFGLPATRKNYELTLEQVALESPEPNASRLVRKNLAPPPAGTGVLHRGGPLFAARAGDASSCDLTAGGRADSGPLDEQDAYCVIVRWIAIERAARMGNAEPLTGIVYVKRPRRIGPDAPQDFEAYAAGADVLLAPAKWTPDGLEIAGPAASLLPACGLDPTSVDARRPAVSWDASSIAFSARASAAEPWRIYVTDGKGSCEVEPTIDAPAVDDEGDPVPDNGELVHNFDPAFAPDGRIVFASTRGNTKNRDVFDYQGPQRTPADPRRLNANLYVAEGGKIRQLTFLLNQELLPSFMRDGRVIFTTEKRAPGFYQLAGRRQNLDGGDYHPLFGQRPTIGYDQFTDVVELADKDFAAIVSQKGAARGAGTIAVINRSIGIDQLSADPSDYVQDPSAIDWPNEKFYQHSIRFPDPAATGRLAGTTGAYRTPSPLPDGNVLASYAAGVTDLRGFDESFDVVVLDLASGARRTLLSDPDDLLWPVAAYGRPPGKVFESRPDEPNGHTVVYDDARRDRSDVTVVDMPVLASLLFQNTRSRRPIPDMASVTIWESLPPEPGVTDYSSGGEYVTGDRYGELYVRRRRLGAADLEADGSVRVQIPGGTPIILEVPVQLAGDAEQTPHHQREEMQFYPGEVGRQSFKRALFNGLCAGCHGSVTGLESHVAINPDILTAASVISAAERPPVNLLGLEPGPSRGPPFP